MNWNGSRKSRPSRYGVMSQYFLGGAGDNNGDPKNERMTKQIRTWHLRNTLPDTAK